MANATVTRKSAKSNTGASPSDVVSRRPVSEAASASVKGAAGAGTALLLIREVEQQGDAHAKMANTQAKSNKDRIKDLLPLSNDDREAFIGELIKRVAVINDAAKKSGLSVSAYREANPKEDYVYVTLSIWKTIAYALNSGWAPDLENNSWMMLRQQAAERLNKAKAEREQADLRKQIDATMARTDMPDDIKAATVKALEFQMAQRAVSRPAGAQSSAGRGGPAAPATPSADKLIAEMQKLVETYPIHMVEQAFVWLGTYISGKSKSSARLVNETMHKLADAHKGAPAETKPAANDSTERAVAKSDRVIATPPGRKAKSRK